MTLRDAAENEEKKPSHPGSHIDVVRLSYSDLLGTDRGRDIIASTFDDTTEHGVAFCRAIYGTTTQGDVVDFTGSLSAGLPDIVAVPDTSTLRDIPWEPGVSHCLADVTNPDGTPSLISPRQVLKKIISEFATIEATPIIGPELEFYVLEEDQKSENKWKRYGEAKGNVYVVGRRGDPESLGLSWLRSLNEYGLKVTAANHEFSSGQFEINLWHSGALCAADRAFRFKSAVKELARTRNKMATFMAKPFNDEGGSGFHVHFSLVDRDGQNLFADENTPDGLTPLAHHAIAGILAHAPALAALANPTINSYKRFGPDTLAPWLIDWGHDNRSALVRVPPERGRATRLEVRLGDASANPYLITAGIIAAASIGIRKKLPVQDALEGYGYDPEKADMLPTSLSEALDAFEKDTEFVSLLGAEFAEAYLAMKRNEIERFSRHVTDWEFREYAYHL